MRGLSARARHVGSCSCEDKGRPPAAAAAACWHQHMLLVMLLLLEERPGLLSVYACIDISTRQNAWTPQRNTVS